MYLIEVIPFARLPRTLPESFSYYSPEEIPEGAVVKIEIAKRRLLGMVARVRPVKNAKQDIRTASFMLKKVAEVVTSTPIMNTRDRVFHQWLAEKYLTSPATILRMLVPLSVFKRPPLEKWGERAEIETKFLKETEVVIRASPVDLYRERIAKALAQDKQVICIAPEVEGSRTIFENLSSSFEGKIVHLTSGSGEKAHREIWQRARSGEALAVIGTRIALFLPFTRLGLIIVDDDGAPAHKSWDMDPKYHVREVADMLHTLHGGKLMLAGMPPSLDAYERARTENAKLITEGYSTSASISLFVDMQKEMKEAGEFAVFSEVLKDKLITIARDGGRAFLFVNRKGFAPFILCQQCSYVFKCTNCAVPLVYHAQESLAEPTLLCHHCSAKNPAPNTCPECGSAKLKAYGIGVERVAKDLKKLFPGTTIITISADEHLTPKQKINLIARLETLPSYIAIGTEYAIPALRLPRVELAAIITIETLLSLPDYAQNERMFRVLTLVRALAIKIFILQSYAKEPEVLQDLFHGSFEHFAEKELKERKRYSYPPHGELIKLTIRHPNRESALAEVKKLYSILGAVRNKFSSDIVEVTHPYPAYIEKKRGLFIFHILLKIKDLKESRSIKATLAEILPPNAALDIGPLTLL